MDAHIDRTQPVIGLAPERDVEPVLDDRHFGESAVLLQLLEAIQPLLNGAFGHEVGQSEQQA